MPVQNDEKVKERLQHTSMGNKGILIVIKSDIVLKDMFHQQKQAGHTLAKRNKDNVINISEGSYLPVSGSVSNIM